MLSPPSLLLNPSPSPNKCTIQTHVRRSHTDHTQTGRREHTACGSMPACPPVHSASISGGTLLIRPALKRKSLEPPSTASTTLPPRVTSSPIHHGTAAGAGHLKLPSRDHDAVPSLQQHRAAGPATATTHRLVRGSITIAADRPGGSDLA